jgi:D-glycero-beta-D-manno-heptose-7-phosphate kinase
MKDNNLQDILAAFSGKRILIVGDVMLDEYVWGEARRISLEAPIPVIEIHTRTAVPGGAANTASNVASLGGRALLSGIVGRDQQAETLRTALRRGGVDAEELIVDEERPTTTKMRIVAQNQQIIRVDSEWRAPLRVELEDRLLQWVEGRIADTDACVLSDYDKGVVSARIAKRFIGLAHEAGKPVIVDPKGPNYSKYCGATVVTPNVNEAARAVNYEINSDADLVEVGRQLSSVLQGSALLITRGSRGMSLFLNEAWAMHIPPRARDVFDVTGAGDTVVSTLALALAANATLEDAALLANQAASIVVGKFGTATLTVGELMRTEVYCAL